MPTINGISTALLALLLLQKLKETATEHNERQSLTFITSDLLFFVDFLEKAVRDKIFDGHVMKLIGIRIVREMVERRPYIQSARFKSMPE